MGRRAKSWRRQVPWWVSAAIFVAYLHCLIGHAPSGWSASPGSSSAGDPNSYAVRTDGSFDRDARPEFRPERTWVSWARWVLDPASGDSGPLQSTCHNESGCICRGATLSVPVSAPQLSDVGVWLCAAEVPASCHASALGAAFTVDQMRLSLAGDPDQCATRPWRSWHPVYRL